MWTISLYVKQEQVDMEDIKTQSTDVKTETFIKVEEDNVEQWKNTLCVQSTSDIEHEQLLDIGTNQF